MPKNHGKNKEKDKQGKSDRQGISCAGADHVHDNRKCGSSSSTQRRFDAGSDQL